jgi:serine phosphatase RsbU (regulator of sigma subunit)
MRKNYSITRNLMAVVAAIVISAAMTGCAKQEAKQQNLDTKSYAELLQKAVGMTQSAPQSALELVDSAERAGNYPIEVIDMARGMVYVNITQRKESEKYLNRALNENLHKMWPYGYYQVAYSLFNSLHSRDNIEQSLRVATDAYNRILTEDAPELEKIKWSLLSGIGMANLRLHNYDECERIMQKAYEGLKNYVIKSNTPASADLLTMLCANALADYLILLPEGLPTWLDRTEEAISIQKKLDTEGKYAHRIQTFIGRTTAIRAEYLGSIGKLKEAKEAYDAFLSTDFAKAPETIIDRFNYYYYSKQWDKAAELLHDITDYHYKSMKVEPTLHNLCELGLSFRVYENAGRNADAMEIGRMMANLVDSVRDHHLKDQSAEMAALYETKEKDAEIAQQQIELTQQRVIGLIIAIVLLTVFFIIYTLIRKRAAKKLADMKAAQERIESELRIARDIQMSMVPHEFPQREGLDMFASMTPAKEVGGDLYGYLIQGDKLYFALGDVSGKGVPASLFMAQATRLFLTLAKQGMMPAEICTSMNDALSGDDNENGMFVTFWLGLLDMQTGHLDFCNAGHNPPIIGGGENQGDFLEMQPNLPIGLFPGFEYEGEEIETVKGRALFIYTDGLNEAENPQQEQFGDERLLGILRDTHFDSAQQVIESLKAEVENHRKDAEPNDDLTMMCLRVS